MQVTVEKIPDSEVHASEALQPLHLHLQNPEPSLAPTLGERGPGPVRRAPVAHQHPVEGQRV